MLTGNLWIDRVLATGISLLFLCVVFIPLEKAFPAKPNQSVFRPAWKTDLLFFLGQYLVWGGLVLWAFEGAANYLQWIVPNGFRAAVRSQPWWLQAIEVVVLSDICIYWGHRMEHKFDILWRFHSVHHTAEHLDWLAAHREHPLDTIYTAIVINLPPILMGFPLETLVALLAFRGIWAIYIHSNVRIPLGPLTWIIGAPQLHHWHHERERQRGNYANVSPMMDLLFGTYTCPDHEPESVGIHEWSPRGYVGHMIYPLLPRSIQRRVSKTSQPDE